MTTELKETIGSVELPPSEALFNKTIRNNILKAIGKRMHYEVAAESSGITYGMLMDWLDKGQEDIDNGLISDYAKFFVDVRNREMVLMCGHIDNISNKVKKWKADAWILERRWPKYYGNNALLQDLTERINLLERRAKMRHEPLNPE